MPAESRRDDHELIRQVAAGSGLAFRELVERYKAPLYRFIHRYVGRAAVAEELLQETFLRAYRGAAGYESRAPVSTWLFRIAVNLCLNQVASAGERHEVITEAPERAELGLDPAGNVERHELGAAIEAALASLPPDQRTAVLLVRFEEMSYAEVAEVLGVSPGAVDGLLQRARQALRRRLEEFV